MTTGHLPTYVCREAGESNTTIRLLSLASQCCFIRLSFNEPLNFLSSVHAELIVGFWHKWRVSTADHITWIYISKDLQYVWSNCKPLQLIYLKSQAFYLDCDSTKAVQDHNTTSLFITTWLNHFKMCQMWHLITLRSLASLPLPLRSSLMLTIFWYKVFFLVEMKRWHPVQLAQYCWCHC